MSEEDPGDTTRAAYTSAVTSTIGRPPRKTYFVLQVFAFAITVVACVVSARFESTFRRLPMKDLPLPADWIFTVGKFFSQPIGIAVAAFIVLGLGLLALKGVIDGFLKVLIWLNVLWILVFIAVQTMGIWMPLVRGQGAEGG